MTDNEATLDKKIISATTANTSGAELSESDEIGLIESIGFSAIVVANELKILYANGARSAGSSHEFNDADRPRYRRIGAGVILAVTAGTVAATQFYI